MKKWIALWTAFCCTAFLIGTSVIPVTVRAASVTYMDTNGDIRIRSDVLPLPADPDTAAIGQAGMTAWYYTDSDILYRQRLRINGTINLILTEGHPMIARKGIHVPAGSTLILWGQSQTTGTLQAAGGSGTAGIGGNKGTRAGTIIINGGEITADGGNEAAGIGGGSGADFENITINGGHLTVNGQEEAAAIGAGKNGTREDAGARIHLHLPISQITTAIRGEAIGGVTADHIGNCAAYNALHHLSGGQMADSTEYDGSAFMMTIPSEITIGDPLVIHVGRVSLPQDQTLQVTVGTPDGFCLHSDGDLKLPYRLTSHGQQLRDGDRILLLTASSSDGTAILNSSLSEKPRYAARYSGTLTFSVSVT